MIRFSDLSIKLKLIISISSLLIFALSAYSSFILYINYQNGISILKEHSKIQSYLISDHAISSLLSSNTKEATEVLAKLNFIPNINEAIIYDEDGKLFSSYTKHKTKESCSNSISKLIDSTKILKDELIISTPIIKDSHTYGAVVFHVSMAELQENMFKTLSILFLSIVILIFLSLFIIHKVQRYITRPIINLARITKEISKSNDYTVRAQKMYQDEVGDLYDCFNSMLDKIEQRGRQRDEAESISRTYQAHLEHITDELEERVKNRTTELQQSLNNLKETQHQLIESEKMSSLGNLVAGVAHEVNTPLGISITAASIFENEIKKLKLLLKENKLTKNALEEFLNTITEADDMLVKNLDRAAILVRNFKKISVDQSCEEIRDFELNSYLKEVLSTFKNELKHRPITLKENFAKEPIQMHSYPGPISQLVVNMLQNSLLHAFDEDQEGEIIIKTYRVNDVAVIHFIDNGKGIDEDVINRVFEPFVTTKRNSGGTGLGLNIVYNLVTQRLKGTIKLNKEHSQGAYFIIEIPCKI